MRVDRRVTGSSRQVLVFTIRDMLLCLRVAVLLGQAEINAMHLICLFANADEEIIGLDIAMDKILGVHVLDTVNHLICKHENCLEGELAIAEVEEILERRSQQIDNHDVVVTLDSVPMHIGDTNTAGKNLVEFGLVKKLRMLGLDGLKLDGNLLVGLDVGADVDVTERT